MIGFVTSGQRCKNELWHLLYSKKPKTKERFDEYTRKMASVVNKPEKVEYLRTYVLDNGI